MESILEVRDERGTEYIRTNTKKSSMQCFSFSRAKEMSFVVESESCEDHKVEMKVKELLSPFNQLPTDSLMELHKQNEELQIENKKLKQLMMTTKLFSNMVIHDLKHPISSFAASLEIVKRLISDCDLKLSFLEKHQLPESDSFGELNQVEPNLVEPDFVDPDQAEQNLDNQI